MGETPRGVGLHFDTTVHFLVQIKVSSLAQCQFFKRNTLTGMLVKSTCARFLYKSTCIQVCCRPTKFLTVCHRH